MHWYGGSIAEAVTLSKQKNAIFVVFVEGDNDLSAEMSATIDDSAVVSRLSNQDNFLAVKLKSGTVNYTHFAQIYQFVPVPSLFFIGRNGTPLEVVCAGVQPNNLATRIDRILAEHYKDKPPTIQPSTSSQHLRQQTTNLLQAEAAATVNNTAQKTKDASGLKDTPESSAPPAKIQKVEESKRPVTQEAKTADRKAPEGKAPGGKTTEYETVCDGDVCVRRPKVDAQGASTSAQGAPPPEPAQSKAENIEPAASDTSIDDKVERAKQVIEAKRKWQAEKDKELEKQKELERRTTGQGVAELKRWQADQELKQIQEERKREKMENNLARQRILEQIAQDRAERRARDAPPPPPPDAAHPAPAPAPTPAPAPAHHTPPTSGDAHTSARIQFKLPDGSSHTAHFPAANTLALLQRYVADNLQLSSSQFSLWTAFPRREITESDRTLRELQLAPSAALLVLPRRNTTPPQPTGFSVISFITQLLTTLIYDPTLQLYHWVRSRLFPPPAVSPRSPPPPTPAPRPAPSPAAPLRRRGNIHRLPGDAPDDDNNTWNGNSTQQM